MDNKPEPVIELPQLSDESVIEIHSFLETLIHAFESHYTSQIWRYYDGPSQHNLDQPAPAILDDDPPF